MAVVCAGGGCAGNRSGGCVDELRRAARKTGARFQRADSGGRKMILLFWSARSNSGKTEIPSMFVGEFAKRDFRRRRQKILRRPFETADLSRRNFSRPMHNHRHAKVVCGNVAVEKFGVNQIGFFRDARARKENHDVVGHPYFLQLLLQLADVAVNPRNQRGPVFFRLRPVFLGERRVGRHFDLAVWDFDNSAEEKTAGSG